MPGFVYDGKLELLLDGHDATVYYNYSRRDYCDCSFCGARRSASRWHSFKVIEIVFNAYEIVDLNSINGRAIEAEVISILEAINMKASCMFCVEDHVRDTEGYLKAHGLV